MVIFVVPLPLFPCTPLFVSYVKPMAQLLSTKLVPPRFFFFFFFNEREARTLPSPVVQFVLILPLSRVY